MIIVRVALSACALSLGLSTFAHAQTAPPTGNEQASTPQSLDEVTVTGSRIRRTTDFTTANPTTVVDASYLQNLGIVNVGAAITQLPSNISNNTPTTTGNANFFTGSTIANLRGLNPFFGSRTLTLVNTRRFVPTNQGDGVDLNFIPSLLIDRVDSVTGGASAAYGSGAIAGVQNIFLNTKLEGGRADVDYQQSMHSDGRDKHAGLAYGHGFANDRGHFVLGGEWEDMDEVGCQSARDFCTEDRGFFQNTQNAAGVGSTYLYGTNLRSNQTSESGVFLNSVSGANTVYQADTAGTGLVNFTLGEQPYASGPGASPFNVLPGGDGIPIYQYTNLRAPVDRYVVMGTFNFEITDSINLSMDASYGHVETKNLTAALGSNFVAITPFNPFVTPQMLPALNIPTGFGFNIGLLNKAWNLQSDSFTEFTTDVKRASVGLDGKFGDSSWTWDAYYQYGRTNRRQLVHDNLHNNATALALNVVTDPATGQPICAAKLNPASQPLIDPALIAACVPVNPFGTAELTQAQHDYIFGDLDERLEYTQQVAAVNASGSLFAGFGAGDITGAIGYEHRDELGHNREPELPAYIRADYLIQYGEPFGGKVKVDELYVEANVPIAKDVVGAKRLELDLAARQSHYKNQGLEGTTGLEKTHDLTTWKASALWDPVDWLRLRGSQSRDARAGNFRELYYGQIIGAGGLFGYCGPGGTFQVDPCDWHLEGNVEVKPERSDTTTFGFVLSPKDWGLQFSVDYFRIKIQDAIQQANPTLTLDGCRVRNEPDACALITFDGTSYTVGTTTYQGIQSFRALATNGAAYEFKGLDFSGSYNAELGKGRLIVRLLAENMFKQQYQNNPLAPPVDIVGQTGNSNSFLSDYQPQPKWTGTLTGTYELGGVSVTGQMRYIGHGIMDYNNPTGGVNPSGNPVLPVTEVPSYQVFSLAGSYAFQELGPLSSLQIYGVIDNLTDKQPPFASGITQFGLANAFGGTNATFFDTLGRMYRVGLRMKF